MKRLIFITLLLFEITQFCYAEAISFETAKQLWQQNNADLRLSQTAVQAAQADRQAADQSPNPQFSWSASSLNPKEGLGKGKPWNKNADQIVRLDQVIERGGKRHWRTEVADLKLQASEFDRLDQEIQGLIQLSNAYFDLKQAQDKETLLAATTKLAQQAETTAEKRLKAGDLSPNDAQRFKIEALRAEQDWKASQNDLAKAKALLCQMIGKTQWQQSISANEPWSSLQDKLALNTIEIPQFIETLPSYQAGELRKKAAYAALQGARSLQSRDVSVGVQYERVTTPESPPANSFGVSVGVPLFVNYAYEGEIARAQADLTQAEQQLEKLQLQLNTDLTKLKNDYQTAYRRLQQYQTDLVPSAEKIAQAIEFAYQKGAASLMDLLDSRRTLKQMQLDRLTALADYAKSLESWKIYTASIQANSEVK